MVALPNRSSRWSLLLVALLLGSLARASEPAFELRPLGVLGGDDDSNLSSYLLGQPGKQPELLIDAGAFTEGLALWKQLGADPAARARAVTELFAQLDAVLFTHAHLDHVGGFLLQIPAGAGRGQSTPLPLAGLPETLEQLHAHGLAAPLWVDLTKLPAKAPALTLRPIAPKTPTALGAFTVETIPLVHPVPSAAFLITRANASYLHLGDTGPTSEVWTRGQALLHAGTLRAVSVEVSFPDAKKDLALQTGHLTPALLVQELAKLTGTAATPEAVGRALGSTRIIALHIKGAAYPEVVRELQALSRAGLPIVLPERGVAIRF